MTGGANSYLHRQRGARNDPHLISEHELLSGTTGAVGKYDAERTQGEAVVHIYII